MDTRYGAPVAGDEKAVLAGFLDRYRATMLDVCSGLSVDDPILNRNGAGTST